MSVQVEPAVTHRWALRPGVYRATAPGGDLMLAAWPHATPLGRATPELLALLDGLAAGALPLNEPGDLAPAIELLRAGGWLRKTVAYAGRDLYTVTPVAAPADAPPPPQDEPALSRFALLRNTADGLVLEMPGSWCDVHVHDPAVAALLADPSGDGGLPAEAAAALRADLAAAGMLAERDEPFERRQWSTHELWFHERSRLGNRGWFGAHFGGTFWARGRHDPPPARPSPYPGPAVELARPDLAALRRTDPTLTAVLEDRESVRDHDDDDPISAEQLGELLYRCARVRLLRNLEGFEYAGKPYPAGGSAYELEVYPVVRLARGLDPGMYHYDAHDHRLRQVRPAGHPAVRRMLKVATESSAAKAPPQVLLVISARVGRILWKYEAMGYALMLKHVGVLQQTLYAVATAMDLAPCALGSGDDLAFTAATGRDRLVECAVGEFMVGSRRKEPAAWEL
ncbi:SagB family peptide dehydrogenase [Nonomuraea pusilla]|uniref:SagB-type dehydrogenase domain-containing protein n=1 Tax=Nonomuraea pusilla TaxID=46177 RepID=A0A1H7UAY7_9ACTN|nr:SagB family peptide dehydrogenase [Nonomuraea pusilla]SEL93845.1 SagB-type dehydrogenase domain-containing protein [Nonomuraea pusilla]